jgi:hypothetical protein
MSTPISRAMRRTDGAAGADAVLGTGALPDATVAGDACRSRMSTTGARFFSGTSDSSSGDSSSAASSGSAATAFFFGASFLEASFLPEAFFPSFGASSSSPGGVSACSACPDDCSPAPLSRVITASPGLTLSPGLTRMSFTVPATSIGTSTVALSVSSSSTG